VLENHPENGVIDKHQEKFGIEKLLMEKNNKLVIKQDGEHNMCYT